jgi:hypothetical protein
MPKKIDLDGISFAGYFMALSASRLIASNVRMIAELEIIWNEAPVTSSRTCPGILPRKPVKYLSQDGRCLGRNPM